MRETVAAVGAFLAFVSAPCAATPSARFAELTYTVQHVPPTRAGSYRNPILPGFQPDPSIVRVGSDFYLVNSTFAWFPGIPVYHSRDLVHWRQIGNAIDRPAMLDFKGLGTSRAVFAPAIGHADFVSLDDGNWWGVFLATRPFAGQSTLLGRETYLLPVTWRDGWPLFLPAGKPVPLVAKRPALPASPGSRWDRWTDDFRERALSPEWLRIRNPGPVPDHALEAGDHGTLNT